MECQIFVVCIDMIAYMWWWTQCSRICTLTHSNDVDSNMFISVVTVGAAT